MLSDIFHNLIFWNFKLIKQLVLCGAMNQKKAKIQAAFYATIWVYRLIKKVLYPNKERLEFFHVKAKFKGNETGICWEVKRVRNWYRLRWIHKKKLCNHKWYWRTMLPSNWHHGCISDWMNPTERMVRCV